MSIEVKCLECGTTHRVNNRLAGRRVRCPKCETAVHVPELDEPLSEPGSEEQSSPDEEITVEVLPAEASGKPAATVPAGTVNVAELPSSTAMEEEPEEELVLNRRNMQDEELDMTPMVDVTFLLLIFFTVTAAFSLQKSIEMPRQQTDAPSTSVVEEEQDELDMIEVQVDEFGGFLVLATDWERETPGKQNLITALKEAIAVSPDGMRLIIKVHELAKLRALVDAMDAGTIAGYKEIQVTQVEEFD